MTIIERICNLIDERGMKKKTVYEAIGVSPSLFSTWISANVDSIPSEYIPGIAALFGMSCDELLTGSKEKTLTENELHLIALYRDLDWDGQQIVLAEAIKERRSRDNPL